jgi:hypothetical protein
MSIKTIKRARKQLTNQARSPEPETMDAMFERQFSEMFIEDRGDPRPANLEDAVIRLDNHFNPD